MEKHKEVRMVTLVIGASGSGKSEYAERCLDHILRNKFYLATMIASDSESREKVRKHQERRQGRHFQTVECPKGLDRIAEELPENCAILLEGIGTLAANELFREDATPIDEVKAEESEKSEKRDCIESKVETAKNLILKSIDMIASRAQELVIVSDEVNRAGCEYEGDTKRYQRLVGELNQELCAQADRVVEMVCGCPVERKIRQESDENFF